MQAGIGAGGEFVLELLDTTSGIDVLEFAGVERMALTANVDLQFLADASCFEGISATASYGSFLIVRVDAVSHGLDLSVNEGFWGLQGAGTRQSGGPRETQEDSLTHPTTQEQILIAPPRLVGFVPASAPK